jgi:hypothetical protein
MKLFQLIILSTFLTLPALYGAIIKNDVRERSAPKASLGISAKGATLYEQLRDILKSVRSGHLPTDMDHLSDCCSEESNCSMSIYIDVENPTNSYASCSCRLSEGEPDYRTEQSVQFCYETGPTEY